MNVLELINFGSAKLKSHDIKSFKIDSEILLSNVLGKRREEILIKLDQNISRKLVLKFNDLIHRRSLKEPVAYIIKEKEFWSKKFEVNKNTLIPRPETELLIEYLVNIYKNSFT
jgi:release factor glutamine methyltransferase